MNYVSAQNRQRIFIGIPVGKHTQRSIDHLLESMEPHERNLRWVPAANRHLTLAFLGDVAEKDIDLLLREFVGTYRKYEPFHYCFSALERFPNARGRIIALTGEASEPMQGLAMSTRDVLRECGLGYERKKFRPHITLARIRSPKHTVPGFDRQVRLDINVDRIVVYQSTLTNAGSVYTVLQEVELK